MRDDSFYWVSMLIPSSLTLVLLREFLGREPVWWSIFILSCLVLMLLIACLSETQNAKMVYLGYLLLLFLMGYGGGWSFGFIPWVRASNQWISFLKAQPGYLSDIMVHFLRLIPAVILLIIAAFTGKLDSLYLKKGNLTEPVKPTRILGVKDEISWTSMTLRFSAIFGMGTLLFLFLAARPNLSNMLNNIGVLPYAILIAALNAFNEEFTLRAVPLSILSKPLGEEKALAITTVFFALGHYYGVPYGFTGVLLSGFLGWFIGKCMLETRGFLLAWFTHFVPDVIIFVFLLMGG